MAAGLPLRVLRAVAARKVVVLLFWSPRSANDRAVRSALRGIDRHDGKVLAHAANARKIAAYQQITRSAGVEQSPTIVIVDRTARLHAAGYVDRDTIDQAVSDALRNSYGEHRRCASRGRRAGCLTGLLCFSARPARRRGRVGWTRVRTRRPHAEVHLSRRSNWLRAGVLGANDGILSTASLVLGVAASGASGAAIVTAGIAGLVAGALSMAAGEYVSVSSQRDAERADIRLEERELLRDPYGELRELAGIYERRGPGARAGRRGGDALSRRGALAAHVRDELGLDEQRLARPFQAAWTSALSFSAGAALPLLAVAAAPAAARVGAAVVVTLVALGAARRPRRAARWGAAPRRALRVLAWGALAMAVTSGIGALVGTVA